MKKMTDTQLVTPWEAKAEGGFNYDRLQEEFGLQMITPELITNLEQATGHKASHFLTRGIFFAHQDVDRIIKAKRDGKEIFIYTGRGPSADSLHIGHLIPMLFAVYLQHIFDCYVVIEISDEEKFYFKKGKLDEFLSYTQNNVKDIIACGFKPHKTFIFSSFKYQRYMRPLVAQLNKEVTINTANKIYGFDLDTNLGQISWSSYQEAPAMCGAFPHLFGDRKDVLCLIPCAVDQAPYFRSLRDNCRKLGYPKPALICSKFLVALQGITEKMSTSGTMAITVTDTLETLATKIRKYAFTGGGATMAEHEKYGADLTVDIPYIYLCHFMEDDERLKLIAERYSSGKMTTKEIKDILYEVLSKILKEHQQARSQITPDVYRMFMTMRVRPEAREYFTHFCDKYVNIDIN